MLEAPYDSSNQESSGYIDLLTDHFANGVGFLLRAMTTSPVATTSMQAVEPEPWLTIDPAIQGQMSMFQCRQDRTIGVYYQSYTVPDNDLQSWCRAIEGNDLSYGREIVDRLMEPFHDIPSANERDAWLNSAVVSTYITGLQSNKAQVLDPGYYQSDFLHSLHSRPEWMKKLRNASQIFWPICEGSHWYLMILEKNINNRYTVKVLDSFNNREKHVEIAAKGEQLLKKLYKEPSSYRITNSGNPSYLVPVQDNAVDCGTAICYYAYKKTQGTLLSAYASYSNDRCNYVQFRLQMAQSIALNAQFQKRPAVILQAKKPCVIDLIEDDKTKIQPKQRRMIKT